MTAVNRNQAESIITDGSLPRDSTNRQGGGGIEGRAGQDRGNLMGNSTLPRRRWVAGRSVAKCVAREKSDIEKREE